MKNIKRIVQTGIIALTAFFCIDNLNAQPISNHFFGENAWMPDTIGDVNACTEPPCLLNGKLHKHWDDIKNSGASIIRFGGIAADRNMPTNAQYIRMIDSIRANGMEPVIQVPFRDYRYTAGQAADIVHYLNVTKNKHIKYWIIGNEPNLGYSYHTSSQIANYIRPFASAMKNVDPNIIIIGPELAWYEASIMNGLTTANGPDDITGKDAAGHYYIDVISFHTYPFNGSQTRAQVISKLTSAGSLQDNLATLNSRIAACNTAHNRTGAAALKTAITEANVAYQNNSSDDLHGVGTNSFIGGQFLAEMMAIGMKRSVDFINIWSVIEGNSVQNNIGLIDPSTQHKKPIFYHFKMMADNFKGTFVSGTTNQANVKAFASKDGQYIQVMIMNQESAGNYNYTVKLNSSSISGSAALKINVDAAVSNEYSGSIANQSTILLTFNPAGVLIRKTEYSINNAIANEAPVTTEMVSTGITQTSPELGSGVFEIKTFPNPTAGKFTVALNKADSKEDNFDIEIFNLLGQQVYKKTSGFTDGKHQVEMSEGFAQGAYIVRVKEKHGNSVAIQRVVLNK